MTEVTPWDDSQFDGDDDLKSLYYSKLKNRGFDIASLLEEPPIEELIITRQIIKSFDSYSWILFFSNNSPLLKRIGQVVPVVYSLSFKKSAAIVNNSKLEDLFSNYSTDDFIDSRDVLNMINASTFVVHEGFNEVSTKMKNYKGGLNEFFRCREKVGKKYLMLASYNGEFKQDSADNLFSGLENLFGPTVVSMLNNYTSFIYDDNPSSRQRPNWEKTKRS